MKDLGHEMKHHQGIELAGIAAPLAMLAAMVGYVTLDATRDESTHAQAPHRVTGLNLECTCVHCNDNS